MSFFSNPENTKLDLSLTSLDDDARLEMARSWTSLKDPLTHLTWLVYVRPQQKNKVEDAVPIGIAGLGWIGDADNPPQEGRRAGAAGIMLDPAFRRKGYAFEALKMVVDYGLRELGLVEVRLGTTSANVSGSILSIWRLIGRRADVENAR